MFFSDPYFKISFCRIIGSSLTGPLLSNAPFTSDISQIATSICCIHSVVPVLLIASNKHQILHGILLDKDEADVRVQPFLQLVCVLFFFLFVILQIENDGRGSGILSAKHELLFIERLELTTSSASSKHERRKVSNSAKLFNCKNGVSVLRGAY